MGSSETPKNIVLCKGMGRKKRGRGGRCQIPRYTSVLMLLITLTEVKLVAASVIEIHVICDPAPAANTHTGLLASCNLEPCVGCRAV